jgi:hypothetical protein
MADVSITLGVIGNALTSGLNKARKEVDGFAGGAASSLSRLTKSLGVLGGGFTLGAIVKQGFEFNQTMQDGEVAISNVLKTFKGLNDEAAKSEAAKVVQLIAEAEPRAAGGLQELTQGFIATAAAAASAGISAEENVDLVARFANALSNSGLPLEQLNQELRSVLTATVTSDSFIGKLLEGKGLDTKRITQLSQEGKLYDEIVVKLGAMGEAGDTAGVAFSTLQSAISKAAGALTADMFDKSVTGANNLTKSIDANIGSFKYLGSAIGDVIDLSVKGIGLVGEFFQFNNAIGTALGELITGGNPIEAFNETMEGFKANAATAASTATANPSSGSSSGPAASKSEIESTLEKQKKQTYDIGKNIQDQAKAVESVLDPYRQFLDYLDEAKKKQEALNESAKAAKQAAQTKVESQKNFAQSLEDEVKILEAKATGDEDAIKKAEREVEIKNRAREIQQQLGKNAKEALDIAERMQALQDAANEAADGKGKKEGRIQGYSQERQGGRDEARARADQRMDEARERIGKSRERGFGGIGEFYENQKNPNFARPQTPMLDASRLRPVQSSVDSNASVTVLNEMKALAERSTKALESIAVV